MQNSRGDILKPVGTTQKIRKSNSSELETALRYNVQLEKENTTLRAEIHDLALKNDNLLQALTKNKEKFQGDFNKLQEEIRINEKQLVENSRKCLEQQNKFADEVSIANPFFFFTYHSKNICYVVCPCLQYNHISNNLIFFVLVSVSVCSSLSLFYVPFILD